MLRINKSLDKVLSLITAITLIIMMLHVVLNALLRYFVLSPIDGTNEIVAYWYLPIVALLGIPAAQLRKEHIAVSLVLERMSHKTAQVFKFFACSVGALLSLGFAWFGFEEALSNMASGSTAGVTQIITWPAYMLVPLVFVLLALLFIGDSVAIVRRDQKLVSNAEGESTLEENVS